MIYKIDIIETLQMRVEIEADNPTEALELAHSRYYDEEYILDADNSNVSTEFVEVEDQQ